MPDLAKPILDAGRATPAGSRPAVALAMGDNQLRDTLLPAPLWDRLSTAATIVSPDVLTSYETAHAREVLEAADVLLTGWGAPKVTPEVLDHAPRLQLIAHAAGSLKAVLDPACYHRGITVTTAAQANAWPVAQWTLAMIILAGKRVLPRSRAYAETKSRRREDSAPLGNHGTTVGIIGASRIGRLVMELLPQHRFRVLLADPTVSAEEAAQLGAELVPLDELMADSDVVSLHAPILDSTIGMITAELLASMKDGATFINSARGVLVDHDGLRAETSSGRIDAILDVTYPEPLPADDILWTLPNVWLTPHVAGAQGREVAALGEAAVSEIEAFAAGRHHTWAIGPEQYHRMA